MSCFDHFIRISLVSHVVYMVWKNYVVKCSRFMMGTDPQGDVSSLPAPAEAPPDGWQCVRSSILLRPDSSRRNIGAQNAAFSHFDLADLADVVLVALVMTEEAQPCCIKSL